MVSAAPLAVSSDIDVNNGNDGSPDAPSGFILKLFQMVTGAPDEVISVSSYGCWEGSLVMFIVLGSLVVSR